MKFYTSDPQNLHDELTRYMKISIDCFEIFSFRYLFVLQLKEDIRTGKLDCPADSDVELAALTMQGQSSLYILS